MTSQTAGRMRRMPNAARAELANSPVREGARSPVNGNNDDKRDVSVTVRKHPFHLSLAIEAIHGERNTAPYTSAKAMTYAGWRRHLPNINKALAAARHTIWTSPAPSRLAKKVDRHDPEHDVDRWADVGGEPLHLRRVFPFVQELQKSHQQNKRRGDARKHGDGGAKNAGLFIADIAGHFRRDRARQGVGNGENFRKLFIGHPPVFCHHFGAHERDRGRPAPVPEHADAEKSKK